MERVNKRVVWNMDMRFLKISVFNKNECFYSVFDVLGIFLEVLCVLIYLIIFIWFMKIVLLLIEEWGNWGIESW